MRKWLSFVRNVASPDVNRRFYAAKLFGEFVAGDFRVSWSQLDWWRDEDFTAYLRRFGELDGLNTHRKWTLWQLLRLVAEVDGDTAECGVFEGASSWLICRANQAGARPRTHHAFDSFEGVSKPSAEDGEYWEEGYMSAGEDVVLRNLAPFRDQVTLHKGWIPDRFPDVADRRFAFVHVDVDLAQPTRDSLEFFYERMNPGAVLLCDDYGFTSCPGATSAIDGFLEGRPEKMISLDAGGGFFIKGAAVAPRTSALA